MQRLQSLLGSKHQKYNLRKTLMKRIRHNDLTHYFLRDREELPKAYLKKVDKFMWEIRNNLITKRDAAVLYKIKQDKK